MAKIVSFINYKGGVGKTTLAVEIAASLAYHHGQKVLLVDLDPQTNATFYLMQEKDWDNWQKSKGSLKNLFDSYIEGRSFDIKTAIKKDFIIAPRTGRTVSLHLLPSHISLLTIDLKLAGRFGAEGTKGKGALLKVFEQIKNEYDFIICDCPPSLNLITQNAIISSNGIVIVAVPEFLSTLGIALIQSTIKDTIKEVNDDLSSFGAKGIEAPKIIGIIFNRVKYVTHGTTYQQEVMNRMKEEYPGMVFQSYVSESGKIAERGEDKIPIAISGYARDKNYEMQLYDCAKEFIRRTLI
ncbi:MAG: AAA family ATPase [Euryarchaeota archaeon]|nr:AAA family ATPase [Euryarchaeota archaeon]MBU4220473.1 AAA family ATPase [Euryarchaeota archaeon]MCG2736078.1 AAA family ATPase [Candidatus Methanoperedenaceae archaeon]